MFTESKLVQAVNLLLIIKPCAQSSTLQDAVTTAHGSYISSHPNNMQIFTKRIVVIVSSYPTDGGPNTDPGAGVLL